MLGINDVLIGSFLTAFVAIVSIGVSALISITITNRSVESARKQWRDEQVLNSRIRKSEYVRAAYEQLAVASLGLGELTYAGWEDSVDQSPDEYRTDMV